MKLLVCLGVAVASIAILQASDLMDGPLQVLIKQITHSELQNESFNPGNPFGHAEAAKRVHDPFTDPVAAADASGNSLLSSAAPVDAVRDELQVQKAEDNLRHGGVLSGQKPGDEPSDAKNALDLEILNRNPNASILNKAHKTE